MPRSEIIARFGEPGIWDYASAYGRLGTITDDTQMTLFTAEGMLRGWVRFNERGIGPSFVTTTSHAFVRWLETQGYHVKCDFAVEYPGWLITHKELFSQREPGED